MNDPVALNGVIAIPQTPFDQRDRVDLDSLRRGVADRLAAGVDAILYPVVASEVSRLTDVERREATVAVVEAIAGAVPVIVGASADDPATVRSYTELAVEHGAAGVLVQAPTALLADEPAILAFFRAVAEVPVDLLMIQDLEWGGPGLPVPTIARLAAELEPFRAIKVETVPAGAKYTAIREALGGRLAICAGWAVPYLVEALDRGIDAVTPGGLHWPIVEIVRRYRRGDRDGARDLFDRLLPVLVWQNQHIDISNQFLKLLAVRQGIYRDARLRRPDLRFDEVHQRIAAELIEEAVTLHAAIGWQFT